VDLVSFISAGAAGLAAVLAGANLYISGRRELDAWVREALIETLTTFLEGSFKCDSACTRIYKTSPQAKERDLLRRMVVAAHREETEALTRLRMLATPKVVEIALALLEAEYHLAEPCFYDSSVTLSVEAYTEMATPIYRLRAQFVEAARSALGVRSVSGTGNFDSNFQWDTLTGLLNEEASEEPPLHNPPKVSPKSVR
jgi:hypothetical protein